MHAVNLLIPMICRIIEDFHMQSFKIIITGMYYFSEMASPLCYLSKILDTSQ